MATTGELVDVATELVTTAGRMLRTTYFGRRDLQSRIKGMPHEVVTEADTAAHRLISDRLEALRPGDGLTSEEGHERDGELTWLVDPLDGTSNFVRGVPHWCVAASCLDASGAALATAVYDPNRDELFTADSSGTRLNATACSTSAAATLVEAHVLTGLGVGPNGRDFQREVVDAVLAASRSAHYYCAPILDQAWVACGRADASIDYWLHGWDVIPGRALVLGAGGATTECTWPGYEGGQLTAATPELLDQLVAASRAVATLRSGSGGEGSHR